MRSLLAIAACIMGVVAGSTAAHGQSPRAALDPLTSRWTGTFTVYTPDGQLVESLQAEHRYRWDGDVQRGTIVDRYPDGRVVRSTARNYVSEEGTLVCEVTRENGERTVHTGRVRGETIFWHRETEDGLVESFRERVVDTPQGREYRIDGFGAYPSGDTTTYLHFKGRYQETDAAGASGSGSG